MLIPVLNINLKPKNLMTIQITPFFDPDTFSYSYVIDAGGEAAIIDAVLDYDPASGKASTESADRIAKHVRDAGLSVLWVLDTHVHADHLSASHYLQQQVGGATGIGARVTEVQEIFSGVFNAGAEFATDGSQFDRLLADGDELPLGDGVIRVMATPGHTPACVTYLTADCAFVGDTLFMPDYGTARADFPGGDAHQLYASIHRILQLDPDTRLFMCHDYGTDTRTEFAHETSVRDQREANVHIHDGIDEENFVEFRRSRDKQLAAPRLLYPSVQFNMRAGAFPAPEENGQSYFKIPVRMA